MDSLLAFAPTSSWRIHSPCCLCASVSVRALASQWMRQPYLCAVPYNHPIVQAWVKPCVLVGDFVLPCLRACTCQKKQEYYRTQAVEVSNVGTSDSGLQCGRCMGRMYAAQQ